MTKRPIMDSKILDLIQRTNEKMQSFRRRTQPSTRKCNLFVNARIRRREHAIFSSESAFSDEKTQSSRRSTPPPTRKRNLLVGARILRGEDANFCTTGYKEAKTCTCKMLNADYCRYCSSFAARTFFCQSRSGRLPATQANRNWIRCGSTATFCRIKTENVFSARIIRSVMKRTI